MGDEVGGKVTGSAASNLMITGVTQFVKASIGFASAVVLARLLTPSDFGVMAAVAPVVALAVQMQSLGISQAIIQSPVIEKHQIDTLFWASMAISGLLAGLVIALSYPLSLFFGDERLPMLYCIGAMSIVLTAAAAQPTALLARQLRFRAIAYRDVAAALLTATLAIVVAIITRSYWALMCASLAEPIATLVISARAARWRPGRPRIDPGAKSMLKFGAGISIANLLSFSSRNADNILIGHAYSTHALGVYDRAYRLLLYPLSKTLFPVGRVLVPTLSRRQDDKIAYLQTYNRSLILLLLLVHPGLLVSVFFSHEFIMLLLGPKWLESADVFFWLGMAGIVQMYTSTVGWLFVSQGRGRDYALASGATSVVSVLSFLFGLQWGVVGVAASFACSEIFFRLPYMTWFVTNKGPVTFGDMIRIILPHFCACAVALFALACAHHVLPAEGILLIAVALCLSYVTYLATLLLASCPRGHIVHALERCLIYIRKMERRGHA